MTNLIWIDVEKYDDQESLMDIIQDKHNEQEYFRISCDSGVFIYDGYEERILDITSEIDEAVVFHDEQFRQQFMELKYHGTPEQIIDLVERFGYGDNITGEDE